MKRLQMLFFLFSILVLFVLTIGDNNFYTVSGFVHEGFLKIFSQETLAESDVGNKKITKLINNTYTRYVTLNS